MSTAQAFPLHARAVNPDIIDWLAGCEIFSGLGPGALNKFASSSELLSFEPLTEAVIEGEAPDAINIVVSGRFVVLLPCEKLTRLGDSGMMSLDCYLSGDSFAEAALIDDPLPATASIVATEKSDVLSISREKFLEIIAGDARIGQIVFRNLFAIQTRRLGNLAA
ncbi:MAG: cyclic nucleotide-binding domain-containing protein [Gammaproteobacteria bacterium]|nr:cyclic nucleotide-binding domain-containing protein [Gammaproteobacteria bacterium]